MAKRIVKLLLMAAIYVAMIILIIIFIGTGAVFIYEGF